MKRLWMALAALMVASLPLHAVEMGDDGLHKTAWMRDTFKDLRDDLDEANAEGKRLMVIFEQRGCIYCTRMHEKVFPEPKIDALLREKFFVVQINLFGDVEVTDFDGESLPEKEMAMKWGVMFTPTILFFPEEVSEDITADRAAVVTMPGAFERSTTFNMLNWVLEKGYEGSENFQKYHARMFAEKNQKDGL